MTHDEPQFRSIVHGDGPDDPPLGRQANAATMGRTLAGPWGKRQHVHICRPQKI